MPTSAIRSSGQVFAGRVFPFLGMFLSGMVVARAEGPRSFGLYSAAFALGSLCVGGATAGFPILLLRRASERDLDGHTLRRAVRFEAGFLIIALAVTACVGFLAFGGIRGALPALAAGLYFAASNMATMGQNVQCGNGNFRRGAMADFVAGSLFPILTLVAVKMGTGITGSLIALALAVAISCSVAWTALPELLVDHGPSPLKLFDGMPFTAFGLVHAGYGRLDAVILALVAGHASAGYYSAAYRLMGPFALIGATFTTVYFTRLSGSVRDRVRWEKVRRRGSRLMLIIALPAMAALLVFTPFLIQGFYGPSYQFSIDPARVLLLSIVPWSLYLPKLTQLASVRLEMRSTIALGLGMIFNLLLVLVFGKVHGAMGAASAWVGSQFITFLTLSLFSRRIADRLELFAPVTPTQR